MIHQTDMMACAYYRTPEYQDKLAELVASVRVQLDSGVGDKLFDMYRAKAANQKDDMVRWGKDYRYTVILIGALMMRAGARIRDDDVRYMRDVVPMLHCQPGFASKCLPSCKESSLLRCHYLPTFLLARQTTKVTDSCPLSASQRDAFPRTRPRAVPGRARQLQARRAS